MEYLKVYINEELNEIQVLNDGIGIPITYHSKENVIFRINIWSLI